MSRPVASAVTTPPNIHLLGNPNTGKSCLFNAFTGIRQKVANFPGVTVEARVGSFSMEGRQARAVDLPGTYSLAGQAPDERIAIGAISGAIPEVGVPDAVMVVVDASNLDRNLYLLTQVLESDLPVVVALTMVDIAERRGIHVDAEALAKATGVPVIAVHAPTSKGLEALLRETERVLKAGPRSPLVLEYPEALDHAIEEVGSSVKGLGRGKILRLVVDGLMPPGAGEELLSSEAHQRAEIIRSGSEKPFTLLESQARYKIIGEWVKRCRALSENASRRTFSDRVDDVLTHKLWGTLIFSAVMLAIFEALYSWSGPFMGMIEDVFSHLSALVDQGLSDGPLKGLLIDGVIGGVGGILVFLPQILFLFLFVTILEDLGYMARAAFLMDRIMSRFGLSGKSFIPMLSGFACAIPGIMATRTIRDRKTRLATILLIPFMSCSARLPVYTLLIGAFVPAGRVGGIFGQRALALFIMYMVGVAFSIPTAIFLRRWLIKGDTEPFLMELPSYRLPQFKTVLTVIRHRAGSFMRKAGTVILAVSILVWALAYYPRDSSVARDFTQRREKARQAFSQRASVFLRHLGLDLDGDRLEGSTEAIAQIEACRGLDRGETEGFTETDPVRRAAILNFVDQEIRHTEEINQLEREEAGAYLRGSFLGRAGRVVEPVVAPLGWDWRIGMAALASFPAREIVVATLGTIFNVGEVDENSGTLVGAMKGARTEDGQPLFSLATALSIMVFFALCAQCAATLSVIAREAGSWRWAFFSFFYMTGLGYLAALLTNQAARVLLC